MMRARPFMTVLTMLSLATSVGVAEFTASHSGPLPSDGLLGDPANGSFTFEYAGPDFLVGDLVFSGVATSGDVGSYLNELQIWITDPAGNTAGWSPAWGCDWSGAESIELQAVGGGGVHWVGTAGTWTFTFAECHDDAGVDATWTNIVLEFPDAAAPRLTYASDTTTGPTWHRPLPDLFRPDESMPTGYFGWYASRIATETPYHVQTFGVSVEGEYTLESVQDGWDGIVFLYVDYFDPLAVPHNAVVANDDGPDGIGTSVISGVTLNPDDIYFLVTTGVGNDEFGPFTNTVYGPGEVELLPAVCRGDCDCDGDVDFDDIDYFVAALGGFTSWSDMYRAHHDDAPPPCLYEGNCDVNGDGAIDFDDIDAFVSRLGQPCP